MKIESYDVNMQANSSHVYEEHHSTKFTVFSQHLFFQGETKEEETEKKEVLELEKNNMVKALLDDKELSHDERIKKKILEILLSKFADDSEFKLQPSQEEIEIQKGMDEQMRLRRNDIKTASFRGFHFESTHEYYQKSTIDFSSQASIKTNRGQINIDLDLSFSQEFYEVHKTSISSNQLNFIDPLIINYDGNLKSFDNISSNFSFEFDLNSDGENEIIPQLKDGAGFLALDKNQNGIIDNGNELFGANTGDGFEELREYDEDGNNWIDENDSIFNSLLVWEKNKSGEGSLIALGQAGVGAIYLSSVDSDFTYSASVNNDYARLKQSSFYLKESGQAGLITGSDFAV